MKKNSTIEEIQKEIAILKEAAAKKTEKKDETVCPECGNDLEYVEDGVVYCSHCKQYYDIEEEED